MGFFSKKNEDKLVLLLSDGSVPVFNGQKGFDEFIEALTMTPEKYDGHAVIEKADINAYADAMAVLMSVGLDKESDPEKIYSYGPLTIGDLPGIYAPLEGQAVATENYLIVRIQLGFKYNFFMAPYDEIQAIKNVGPMAADFVFRNSLYIDKKGRHHLKDHSVFLACDTGKDGHKNRRAFSLWYTNGHMVKRQFGE